MAYDKGVSRIGNGIEPELLVVGRVIPRLAEGYWQSRTEPLDSKNWEPFLAARIVFVGGVILFAAGVICIIITPLNWRHEWHKMLAACVGAPLFLLALLRQKKRMRLLRDTGVQGRIRKFRALRKREWNLAIGELLANSSVKFVDEHGMVLPHPLGGEAKRSVLLAQDGNLLAAIHEDKGRVGLIQLVLITSEQVETNQS